MDPRTPLSSPLHLPGPEHVAWTRGNLGEALPGLCTPLSWTFFGPATEDGIRGGFHRIGALSRRELPTPVDPGERFATPIFGWPSANIDLMARMAERLPGVEPAQVERELFGEVRDLERHPTRRRYAAVAVRMPVAVAASLSQVRRGRAAVDTWWRDSVREFERPEAGIARAQSVIREARPWFSRHMLLHTIISMLASGLRDQVVALADEAGDDQLPARLITGYGTVEETRVAEDLWALSRDRLELAAFLDRHGWHGINNGQLHCLVWREQPDMVGRLAERYRDLPDDRRPSVRGARQRQERSRAETELLSSMTPAQRARVRAVLSTARRFIAHREVGKAGYLIAVDGARAAARHLGRTWTRQGVLADPDDVFLLTVDEVCAGRGEAWPELIESRREQQRWFASHRLPDAWIGTPEPVAVGEREPEPMGRDSLQGIGVNPGVIEGVARVVLGPDDDFEAGEILVCSTTDPSWVSLFVAAEAIVIDIGGHLSHGAIVARELGIPCVVNTRDGTRQIRTGDRLRVDGRTGLVQILQTTAKDVTS